MHINPTETPVLSNNEMQPMKTKVNTLQLIVDAASKEKIHWFDKIVLSDKIVKVLTTTRIKSVIV